MKIFFECYQYYDPVKGLSEYFRKQFYKCLKNFMDLSSCGCTLVKMYGIGFLLVRDFFELDLTEQGLSSLEFNQIQSSGLLLMFVSKIYEKHLKASD